MLNVDSGIVVIVLLLLSLLLLLSTLAWLLAKFLFDSLGQMGVDVLGQVIFAIETFTAFRTSMHFVGSMDNRMPL